jgi:hypothetical protein
MSTSRLEAGGGRLEEMHKSSLSYVVPAAVNP